MLQIRDLKKRTIIAITATIGLHIIALLAFYVIKVDMSVTSPSSTAPMSVSWSEQTPTQAPKEIAQPITEPVKELKKATEPPKEVVVELVEKPKPVVEKIIQTKPTKETTTEIKEIVAQNPVNPKAEVLPIVDEAHIEYAEYSTLPTKRSVSISDYIGKNKRPSYPSRAIRRGMEGSVEINALVNYLGEIEDIRIVKSSGYQVLDRAVVKTIRDWKIKPTHVMKQYKLKQWVTIPTIEFKLEDA